MRFHLSPIPSQFLDYSGTPYSGGTLEVFLTGDTDHARIYADANGERMLENPLKLDSHGSWIGFVSAEQSLDYLVKDTKGNVVFFFSNVKIDDFPNLQKVLSGKYPIKVDQETNEVSIEKNSIGKDLLKNAHYLVPDSKYLQFKDFAGDVVVTLSESLKTFLEGQGF